MMKLGVNVDHVATIRQARASKVPDPVEAALAAELAGADGITVHLRSDRRHIQERDLRLLREIVKTKLNLEMAVTDEMTKIAAEIEPHSITLVPEKPDELTTEGGLDIKANMNAIEKLIKKLEGKSIIIGAFIDTDIEQIDCAVKLGLNHIEINTGKYAEKWPEREAEEELEKIKRSVDYALQKELIVNGGHGLDYKNVIPIREITGINELNIGHSIVARAVIVGMYEAVCEMLALIGDF
ncbi:MAG: pyridoxine 5'-phosphate synthase [Candidatus Schekmanbacteria bacterium]|nr:MAG: pyridoxine 5'-phosphate synthase [Candidatus Schekmanbacteria bacterium]